MIGLFELDEGIDKQPNIDNFHNLKWSLEMKKTTK